MVATFYREFPVEHVKVEVVGEVLGNPLPFWLFESGKPSTAEMLATDFDGILPVEGAVLGEHPDSPNSSQPLPIDQLYVRSLWQVSVSDL